jgi:hypothetical protein
MLCQDTRFVCRLKGGDGGRFGDFLLLALHYSFEQLGDRAFALGGFAYFGSRSEDA